MFFYESSQSIQVVFIFIYFKKNLKHFCVALFVLGFT